MQKIITIIIATIINNSLFSQKNTTDSINKFDENNQKTGKWINRWIDTKNLASTEYYTHGVRNGLCVYYNENGIIQEETFFLMILLMGFSIFILMVDFCTHVTLK